MDFVSRFGSVIDVFHSNVVFFSLIIALWFPLIIDWSMLCVLLPEYKKCQDCRMLLWFITTLQHFIIQFRAAELSSICYILQALSLRSAQNDYWHNQISSGINDSILIKLFACFSNGEISFEDKKHKLDTDWWWNFL